MKRVVFTVCLIVICTMSTAWAGNYGLDGYRERLAHGNGPLVSIPTYLGAAVGAVALTPISIVYGTATLILLSNDPVTVAKSWVTAPERGWYWGGLIVGTPFRLVKGVIWDVPAGIIGLLFRDDVSDEPEPAISVSP
ncbi:MAG: hypothetical protein J7M12_01715 [Candidatus Hydrogenedentes bacterium]|nr:hypothetical protein [Candidatus Hydrogenedentota bacterium]